MLNHNNGCPHVKDVHIPFRPLCENLLWRKRETGSRPHMSYGDQYPLHLSAAFKLFIRLFSRSDDGALNVNTTEFQTSCCLTRAHGVDLSAGRHGGGRAVQRFVRTFVVDTRTSP